MCLKLQNRTVRTNLRGTNGTSCNEIMTIA